MAHQNNKSGELREESEMQDEQRIDQPDDLQQGDPAQPDEMTPQEQGEQPQKSASRSPHTEQGRRRLRDLAED